MDKNLWINGREIKMQLGKEYLNMSQADVAEALNLKRREVSEAEKSGVEKIRKALEQRGIDIKMLLEN
jgi:DNA-directed RNA polymerase specialized sigma24 family protein